MLFGKMTKIWLRALVGAPDGSVIIRGERRVSPSEANQAGYHWLKNYLNAVQGIFWRMSTKETRLHESACHSP